MHTLFQTQYTLEELRPPQFDPSGLSSWLVEQGARLGLRWLLGHADDGVIWGYLRDNQLRLSGGPFPALSPQLHPATLQKARLFSERGEVFLWKVGRGFAARAICDGAGQEAQAFDAPCRLWGMAADGQPRDGFVKMSEGENGLFHAPPLAEAGFSGKRGASLIMRHYIDFEEGSGQAYTRLSRLSGFEQEAAR